MKFPVTSEFSKPKTYRNRKKHGSKEMQRIEEAKRKLEADHPKHRPYEREHKDWSQYDPDTE